MAPAAKRRKTAAPTVEDIAWDPSARQEYLTGFHKRKQQRIQHAQKVAAEKDRVQRIADRKQIRDQRKQDIERHVQQVNDALKRADEALVADDVVEDDGEDQTVWNGCEDAQDSPAADDEDSGRQDEYIDEDKYTTVTVEPMVESTDEETGRYPVTAKAHSSTTSTRDVLSKGKKKPPKFRYESKADRRQGYMRERVKNTKAASARKARA